MTSQEAWQRWSSQNRERIAQTQRARRNRSTAEGRAAIRRLNDWKTRNPECARQTVRRAKQRRRGMTATDLEYASVLYSDPCSYCGAPAAHVDHIEPIAAGGARGWTNLTSACASCNHQKSARPLLTFLLSREEAA
jgi:5-methylcytosine-specific restriction endonuclease McrA